MNIGYSLSTSDGSLYFYCFKFVAPAGLPKSDDCDHSRSHCSLSALPAIFFHQPKLIVRFSDTHSVEWGGRFKLVMPLLMIACGQYL